MDEDVLGPRQAVLGQRYGNCTRCGAAVLQEGLLTQRLPGEGPTLGIVRAEEATQNAPPAQLCASCVREVAAGEPLELAPDEPEESDAV